MVLKPSVKDIIFEILGKSVAAAYTLLQHICYTMEAEQM